MNLNHKTFPYIHFSSFFSKSVIKPRSPLIKLLDSANIYPLPTPTLSFSLSKPSITDTRILQKHPNPLIKPIARSLSVGRPLSTSTPCAHVPAASLRNNGCATGSTSRRYYEGRTLLPGRTAIVGRGGAGDRKKAWIPGRGEKRRRGFPVIYLRVVHVERAATSRTISGLLRVISAIGFPRDTSGRCLTRCGVLCARTQRERERQSWV